VIRMKLINKHKKLVVLGILLIIFIVLVIFIVKLFIYPTDGPIYGNRLDGIKDVKINDNKANELESNLLSKDNVKSAKMYVQGKIINILIDVETIDVETAKKIFVDTLEEFSKEEKEFYDFQYFITNSSDKDSDSYPVIGYKSKTKDSISWTK